MFLYPRFEVLALGGLCAEGDFPCSVLLVAYLRKILLLGLPHYGNVRRTCIALEWSVSFPAIVLGAIVYFASDVVDGVSCGTFSIS